MIPVAVLRPIVDEWVGEHESAERAYAVLAAATGLQADTWRKRLSAAVYPGPRGMWRGWWSYDELDEADADELLTAMGRPELLAELSAAPAVGLTCEDCGRRITDETGYRPLDLLRPDPSSQAGVIWDATKGKLVVRPGAARAGGRRFRRVDLCRRCAGEALRVRASKSPKVGHRGRLGNLRTRDRVAPLRGGRPRLLDERQLRDLHALYVHEGLSIGDLARSLVSGGKVAGTEKGLYQSMLYGWRRLGLALRPRSEALALAHHRRGRKPAEKRRCPATTAKGKPCTLGPKTAAVYCVSHQHLEAVAA